MDMPDIPCDCTTVQQEDGSIKCLQCNGDYYACDCPAHKPTCEEWIEYKRENRKTPA